MATPEALNLAQVAYGAGFRGKSLTDMVSLGLSESGGDPNALNPRPPDYSVGYWQINYYGGLAGDRTQKYGPPESLRGTDPLGPEAQANARAAYDLSGGGRNLNPWQADFNNGNYYKNLPAAQDAVNAFLGGATAPGAVGSPNTQFPIQLLSDSNSSNNPGDSALIPGDNKCLIKLPGIGSVCLLTQSEARGLLGGVILASGVLVVGLGAALLLSNAVQGTPVAQLASLASGPAGIFSDTAAHFEQAKADKAVEATPEQKRQARENRVARKTQEARGSDEDRAKWRAEGFEAAPA